MALQPGKKLSKNPFSNGQLSDVSIASFIYLVNVLGPPTMCLALC